VVLVFDNPALLPAPRRLVHSKRAATAAAGGTGPAAPQEVDESTPLPAAGTVVRAWLSGPSYKARRVALLKDRLLQTTGEQLLPTPVNHMIVVDGADSKPDVKWHICSDNEHQYHRLDNSRVTDVWMHALALLEVKANGPMSPAIMVELDRGSKYLVLNNILQNISSNAQLQRMAPAASPGMPQQLAAHLLFLYLQLGSNYVESWYYLPISKWIDTLIAHGNFIHQAPNVQLQAGAASWQDGQQGTHLIRILAPAQPIRWARPSLWTSHWAAVRMVTTAIGDKAMVLFRSKVADLKTLYAELTTAYQSRSAGIGERRHHEPAVGHRQRRREACWGCCLSRGALANRQDVVRQVQPGAHVPAHNHSHHPGHAGAGPGVQRHS
jgi:hypothetical protein